jgi:yeast amino acid transporter
VIAVKNAGIKVVPSIVNAVILISVMSVGNSSTYGATRTLHALAEIGQAPKIFTYVDRRGRPLVTIIFILLFGLIAYVGAAPSVGDEMFKWFFAISGLSSFFTWCVLYYNFTNFFRGSICFAHIRFRAAMKAQNQNIDELPFKAILGVWGSWIGLVLNVLCIIAQLYVAISPVRGSFTAYNFFLNTLALPVIIACFIFWKLWHKTYFVRPCEADIFSGRREIDLAATKEEERIEQQSWVWWKR